MTKKKKILIGIGILFVIGIIAQAMGYGDEPAQPAKEEKTAAAPGSEEYIQENITFITVAGLWGVQQVEGKELKNNAASFDAVYYSKDPVKDADGNEYPISILVSGTFKAKDDTNGEFYIALGYKDDQEVKDQKPTILQYVNTTTGDTVNNIDPADDVLSQLMQ